ncbi:MAG: flagellar assembly protein FliW [Lachnospiraceae bacterium]|nr:flagellar assembly protein FliW [Lachnospiraceae bacterium]
MKVNTRIFGEVDIEEEKIIHFVGGIVGFPDMVDFTLIHNQERGPGGIAWLQSMQEPQFAIPVMDPLVIREDYNPQVEDELLKPLGEYGSDDLLVLVTVSVPADIKNMTANLKGPIVINSATRLACQVIAEGDEYEVKFPIYEILKARRAGE